MYLVYTVQQKDKLIMKRQDVRKRIHDYVLSIDGQQQTANSAFNLLSNKFV